MRAPLCFLCSLPVKSPSAPVFVNGERLHAHQDCMAKRLPSAHLEEREQMRAKRGGPKPIGKTRLEERDGRVFTVTVLPEVKPDPKRSQKTSYHLRTGDTGKRGKTWGAGSHRRKKPKGNA